MIPLTELLKLKNIILLSIGILIFYPVFSYAQSSDGSIEVDTLYNNGDWPSPQGMVLKIYQDFSNTPFKILDSIPSNQYKISGLPLNHHYRIEVYLNGLFEAEDTLFTRNSEEKIQIYIPLPVGIRFNVYYNDGQTPINGAKISLRSFEGVPVGESITASDGNSIRFWIPPTRNNEFYLADISLGDGISYTFSPVIAVHGTSGEEKIVTPWPSVVGGLVTVQLYESQSEKVAASKENFIVDLYDSKNNKIAESKINDRGQAYFSNLKVDTYIFRVIQEGLANNTKWEPKEVIIDGNQQEISITKTILQPPKSDDGKIIKPENIENKNNQTKVSPTPLPSCNCVSFRLDDVQDFYLSGSQIAILKKFQEKNAGLTIGVIGSAIGSDPNLTTSIKSFQTNPNHILSIANQGWSGQVLTDFSKTEQKTQILQSNDKIKAVFGVTPRVFFPPSNVYNDDTINILKENGFTHFSAFGVRDPPPYPLSNSTFYRFPSYSLTGHLDIDTGNWQPNSNTEIKESIRKSLHEFGFAVVLMHPYEFSIFNGTIYTGEVNQTMINQLGSLIDDLRTEKLNLVKINQINFLSADITYQNSDVPVISMETSTPTKNIDKNIPNTGVVVEKPKDVTPNGGGCLIATATYGSELSPQVQTLREIRDDMLMKTNSGRSFMVSFNQFYYSFSPTVAEWERSNPILKEIVKIMITPLITSLSILTYLAIDSEAEMITYGILIIGLNLGIYFALPVFLIFRVKKKIKKSKLGIFSYFNKN